jgi:calcineurin-like phosphoesterase family protein
MENSSKYALVHIADIHYKEHKPEEISSVLNLFIDDLKSRMDLLPDYKFYLAITGDIVYSANDYDSYQSFFDEVNHLLDDINIPKERRIIVPGNHDICKTLIEKHSDEHEDYINDLGSDEIKFNDNILEKELIKNKFDNYHLFESEFALYNLDFQTQGKGWTIDNKFGVFCLNSSLLASAGVNNIKDSERLGIHTREIHEWKKNNKTPLNILLMHHPYYDLCEWGNVELKKIIKENFSLCLHGHRHSEVVHFDKGLEAYIIAAPQLFSKKNGQSGYSIILLNQCSPEKIFFRELTNSSFGKGCSFTETYTGEIILDSKYNKILGILKNRLDEDLNALKNIKNNFIKPRLSKYQEFNDKKNLLESFISKPTDTIIKAGPQYGQTCLARYAILEAYNLNKVWLYIDLKHLKIKKIDKVINEELNIFGVGIEKVECIILDSWKSSEEQEKIYKKIGEEYSNIKIIILSSSHIDNKYFLSNDKSFETLYLQEFNRNQIKELSKSINPSNSGEEADLSVENIARDLDLLNIPRTPTNCILLHTARNDKLGGYLLNKTKMLHSVLYMLFVNDDSIRYDNNKPDLEECEFLLGFFCSEILTEGKNEFTKTNFINKLKEYRPSLNINIDLIFEVLLSNNIIIAYKKTFEFRHLAWIFYFAAQNIKDNPKFKSFIFKNQNYINYPEIIEFYTGIDSKSDTEVKILEDDLNSVIKGFTDKFGFPRDIDLFDKLVCEPNKDSLDMLKDEVYKDNEKANLPAELKHINADKHYNAKPYHQKAINQLLHQDIVCSLLQSISASSRALRNSTLIDDDLKNSMLKSILDGWEQLMNIFIAIAPILAIKKEASFFGYRVIIDDDEDDNEEDDNEEDDDEEKAERKFKELLWNIIFTIPFNVVKSCKNTISSSKLSFIFNDMYKQDITETKKHFITILLILERPNMWEKYVYDRMDLLHKNSYYLDHLVATIDYEIRYGFFSSKKDLFHLRKLKALAYTKYNTNKLSKEMKKKVPKDLISDKNKVPHSEVMARLNKS